MKRKFRNLLSYYHAKLLFFTGAVERAKNRALRGDHILSIYFHNPAKEEFEFAIHWLKKEGFSFISIDDLKKIIEGSTPFPKGAVLFTVDDGWASNVENIGSVAHKEEVPITIFVATEAIESGNYWFNYAKKASRMGMGYLSSEDLKKVPHHEKLRVIKEIKEKIELPREAMTVSEVRKIASSPYITIGGHTVTHPILPNCSDREARFEIAHGREVIQGWLGEEVKAFAYPNGSFGERELKTCEEVGYKIAFANNPGFITRDNLKDKYKLPRTGFLDGASNAENICRMMGAWHRNRVKIFNW